MIPEKVWVSASESRVTTKERETLPRSPSPPTAYWATSNQGGVTRRGVVLLPSVTRYRQSIKPPPPSHLYVALRGFVGADRPLGRVQRHAANADAAVVNVDVVN